MIVAAPATSKCRWARAARLGGQEQRRQHDGRDPDRDVDEEDPRPAQVRGQHAAEQHADGRAGAGSGAVDPEREVPLAALGERGHQQRERRRREQRAAEALEGAEADQRGLRPGEAAEQRADGEEGEPRDEQPPAPEQVGEPAAEQQDAAEHDRVGGDHPLQVRLREVQVGLDRRQRDVHDRDVEDDHELRGDDQCECAPAAVRFWAHVSCPSQIVDVHNYIAQQPLSALLYSR